MAESIHHYRVIYADTDTDSVVYHGRYLEFFERGRGNWIRERGTPFSEWRKKGITLPVTHCSIKYHHPAVYDDFLTVKTLLSQKLSRGLIFIYRVYRDETLLVTGETRHLFLNLEGKVVRVNLEDWVKKGEN